MKRNLLRLLIGLSLAMVLMVPLLAFGAGYGIDDTVKTVNQGGNLLPTTVLNKSDLPGAIGAIVSVLLGFLGIVFFGIVLYAGFRWMTAMGNSEKIESAKDMIIGAVVGLVLILGAYALTRLVFNSLDTAPKTTTACGKASGQLCFKGDSCTLAEDCVSNNCVSGKCQ